MTDLSRLTKAEILELLEEEKQKVADLEKQAEEQKKQVELDMSFSETPDERENRNAAQQRKDFIKKMTKGRWVTEAKYQEAMNRQKQGMRY